MHPDAPLTLTHAYTRIFFNGMKLYILLYNLLFNFKIYGGPFASTYIFDDFILFKGCIVSHGICAHTQRACMYIIIYLIYN